MSAYGNPVPDFKAGDVVPHPEARDRVAVRKPNGMYLTVTPDGSVEERVEAHSWESFRKGSNYLLAERDGNVYVLPLAE